MTTTQLEVLALARKLTDRGVAFNVAAVRSWEEKLEELRRLDPDAPVRPEPEGDTE